MKGEEEYAISRIYFETQDGLLCGQHCLNNALQSSSYTPVGLAAIAKQLDDEEGRLLSAAGPGSSSYENFLRGPSNNYDDTGYFSLQVLTEAFQEQGLELIQYTSDDPRAVWARSVPHEERIYIINMANHWFCIRRFDTQWVNLNSNLTKPALLTPEDLSSYINGLAESEGCYVGIVCGELPECPGDLAWRKINEPPVFVTPAEIRAQRAAFLDRLEATKNSSAQQ